MKQIFYAVLMLQGLFFFPACDKNSDQEIFSEENMRVTVKGTCADPNRPAITAAELASMNQKDTCAAYWYEIMKDKTIGINSTTAINNAKAQGKKINIVLGNSLFNQWTAIKDSFPNHAVFNRAFGGSMAEQFMAYKDDLDIALADNLLIYIGENEFLVPWRVDQVANQVKRFIDTCRIRNANLKVVYVKMQVCPKLWISAQSGNWAIDGQNNSMINYGTGKSWFSVCDMNVAMRTWNPAAPRTDCFKTDSVHMNTKGYSVWKSILAPYLLN